MPTVRTVRVRIGGRVQGVGYRAWLEANCQQLGLSGWVRNRLDGSVEAVLQGPEEAVSEILKHCSKGPPLAKVSRLEVIGGPPYAYERFEVLPTA